MEYYTAMEVGAHKYMFCFDTRQALSVLICELWDVTCKYWNEAWMLYDDNRNYIMT